MITAFKEIEFELKVFGFESSNSNISNIKDFPFTIHFMQLIIEMFGYISSVDRSSTDFAFINGVRTQF